MMIHVTQFIFLKSGKEKEFYEFEEHVIPLMEEYNGVLLYRIRPTKDNFITASGELPHEIHLVSFPSQGEFDGYLNDKRRLDYNHLKINSVQSTITTQSDSR